MIHTVIYTLLKKRHFWRYVDFSELSEIYISMSVRSFALGLIGIFVPLYLLQNNYPFQDVILLIVWYFVGRGFIFDVLAGTLTARFGPKHTIMWSYFMMIISTSLFLTLPVMDWPLWLLGIIWGGSTSLFCIPFHVDFSKVKHKAHGGKELGYLNIIEKVCNIMGPLIGGIVATVFGGQYIFLVATLMLILGSLPLLKTAEPIKLNQRLHFRTLNYRKIRRDTISFIGYGWELTILGILWPLYLAVFILSTSASSYSQLGFLVSISMIISIVSAVIIGKLVDRHQGRILLRSGASANALLHLFRPFVSTYPIALLVNVINEGVTVAYKIPYHKGLYDAADDLPGYRVTYFTFLEGVGSISRAGLWLFLYMLSFLVTSSILFAIGFCIASIASLLVMKEHFKALN